MAHVMLILAAVAAAIGGNLQALLDDFAGRSEARHRQQVEQAIRASPELAKQMQELAAKELLTGFTTRAEDAPREPEQANLLGWRSGGTIVLTPPLLDAVKDGERRFRTLDYSRNNPNDLVFILGFMAAKLETQAALEDSKQLMLAEFKKKAASAPKGGKVDVTDLLKTRIDTQLADDARAYLLALNKVTDAAETAKGAPLSLKEFSELMMKMRFSAILFASMELKEGQIVTAPSLRYAVDDHNIRAVTAALGTSDMFLFH